MYDDKCDFLIVVGVISSAKNGNHPPITNSKHSHEMRQTLNNRIAINQDIGE